MVSSPLLFSAGDVTNGGHRIMKKRIVALLLVLILLVPTAIAAAATYYRVNTSSLVVRALPEDNAQTLASYPQDFALTRLKKSGSWHKVRFTDGQEGYVLSKYISKSSSYKAWITNDDTPIRTGPGYKYSNVGTLPRGLKVSVLSHGKTYDYVSSSIGTGYVLNARLSKTKVKASGEKAEPAFTGKTNYDAWISNGYKSVNLRNAPSKDAPIIQAYPSLTKVFVLEHGQTWDHVQINGSEGYMMTQYLTTVEPVLPAEEAAAAAPAPAAGYTAYVCSENTKPVNVRYKAGKGYAVVFSALHGSEVTVLEHGKTWDKISQNGKTGWIMNKYLTLNLPAGMSVPVTQQPVAEPTPFQPYTATVYSTNGLGVNLRHREDSSGRIAEVPVGATVKVVAVSSKYPKTWVKVEYNGMTGYMKKEFLK